MMVEKDRKQFWFIGYYPVIDKPVIRENRACFNDNWGRSRSLPALCLLSKRWWKAAYSDAVLDKLVNICQISKCQCLPPDASRSAGFLTWCPTRRWRALSHGAPRGAWTGDWTSCGAQRRLSPGSRCTCWRSTTMSCPGHRTRPAKLISFKNSTSFSCFLRTFSAGTSFLLCSDVFGPCTGNPGDTPNFGGRKRERESDRG